MNLQKSIVLFSLSRAKVLCVVFGRLVCNSNTSCRAVMELRQGEGRSTVALGVQCQVLVVSLEFQRNCPVITRLVMDPIRVFLAGPGLAWSVASGSKNSNMLERATVNCRAARQCLFLREPSAPRKSPSALSVQDGHQLRPQSDTRRICYVPSSPGVACKIPPCGCHL